MQARGCQTSYFSILLQLLSRPKMPREVVRSRRKEWGCLTPGSLSFNIAAIGSVGDRFVRIGLWSKRRLDLSE